MEYGRFFEISQMTILADELRFLWRAACRDETRYFMMSIKIEEDFSAVSTDGRRLHMVKKLNGHAQAYGLTPGLYQVKRSAEGGALFLVQVLDGVDFPPYQKVIPSGTVVWDQAFPGYDGKHFLSAFFTWFFKFPKPTPLNFNYLRDLGESNYYSKLYEGNDAVVFESENRRAVIMPMFFYGETPAWFPLKEGAQP